MVSGVLVDNMQQILPWQQKAWQYLLARKELNKLPHAILISGIEGVGKRIFAQNLASLLLCESSDACELFQAGNHPDLIIVKPDDKGKAIKVDQVRELIAELNNTSHFGGYRVVIIESADLLNVAAGNALLKTLEEPAEGTVVVLTSANPTILPATIRSRCQTLLIDAPSYFVAKNWLKQELPDEDAGLLLSLSENSPFKALDLASGGGLAKRQEFLDDLYDLELNKISSAQMVKRNLGFGLENLLEIFMFLTSDLIKVKFGVIQSIVNKDQVERLTNLAEKTSLDHLLIYRDSLYELSGHLARKINLNQQMAIESLVVSWSELFVAKGAAKGSSLSL